MTLKDKFGELYIEKGMSFECEKIADEFAIGFAEWSENYTYHKNFNAWIKNNSLTVEKKTSKELLEIYKKEIR